MWCMQYSTQTKTRLSDCGGRNYAVFYQLFHDCIPFFVSIFLVIVNFLDKSSRIQGFAVSYRMITVDF